MNIGEETKKFFDVAIADNRLSHCYIFTGPDTLGTNGVVLSVAYKVLAAEQNDKLLVNRHPDLLILDGELAKIEDIRESIKKLNLKPYQSKRKVAIFFSADKLSIESLNALLKTLEEPTKNTHIFLVTSNHHNLPDTVISRAQIIRINNRNKSKNGFDSSQDEKENTSEVDEFLKLPKVEMLARANNQDARVVIQSMIDLFQDVVYLKNGSENIAGGQYSAKTLEAISELYDLGRVLGILRLLIDSLKVLDTNTNQKILLENIILNL